MPSPPRPSASRWTDLARRDPVYALETLERLPRRSRAAIPLDVLLGVWRAVQVERPDVASRTLRALPPRALERLGDAEIVSAWRRFVDSCPGEGLLLPFSLPNAFLARISTEEARELWRVWAAIAPWSASQSRPGDGHLPPALEDAPRAEDYAWAWRRWGELRPGDALDRRLEALRTPEERALITWDDVAEVWMHWFARSPREATDHIPILPRRALGRVDAARVERTWKEAAAKDPTAACHALCALPQRLVPVMDAREMTEIWLRCVRRSYPLLWEFFQRDDWVEALTPKEADGVWNSLAAQLPAFAIERLDGLPAGEEKRRLTSVVLPRVLEGKDPMARQQAVERLDGVRGPEERARLVRLALSRALKSKDPDVRQDAIAASGRLLGSAPAPAG